MITLTATFLSFALLWQEPVPPTPPLDEPVPQEPAPQDPEAPITGQQIADAIEKVRQSFADLDKSLLETRDFVENAADGADDNTEGVGDRFEGVVADADALLASMEELLEILPDSDQQQQQQQNPSQGQSNGQSKQDGPPEQQDAPLPHDNEQMDGNAGDYENGENEDAEDLPENQVLPIFMKPGQGGAWGHLPPRLQQTLENAQAEDLPLRYRNLLEQYYRKSNDN